MKTVTTRQVGTKHLVEVDGAEIASYDDAAPANALAASKRREFRGANRPAAEPIDPRYITPPPPHIPDVETDSAPGPSQSYTTGEHTVAAALVDQSIPKLRIALATARYDAVLELAEVYESEAGNRVGAMAALKERRESLA